MPPEPFNEREFLARLERANADEFARIIARPTTEEEEALVAYFGEEDYARLHERALRRNVRRAAEPARGNVVVLHGIMGGQLTVTAADGGATRIWLEILRLLSGGITRLELHPEGLEEAEQGTTVGASGILKRAYGELLLTLAERWNVRAFWYDWRKNLDQAADGLRAELSAWFAADAPVHLVAHSMGGLVARTFALRHPERWATMWDGENDGRDGGRLVMLGTPNRGSYDIPQVMTGLDATVRKIARADIVHGLDRVVEVVNSFPGVYQLLPAPGSADGVERLYDAAKWGRHKVSQKHLSCAKLHHERLAGVVDPARMVYVAGFNQPTFESLSDPAKAGDSKAYGVTLEGDGRVTHALGKLDGLDESTYYVEAAHGDLPKAAAVLDSLDDLLMTGGPGVLSKAPIGSRGATDPRERIDQQAGEDDKRLDDLLRQIATRETSARSAADGPDGAPATDDQQRLFTASEREIEELIARDVLGSPIIVARRTAVQREEPPEIEIGLAQADIGKFTDADCIALGHYIGVKPQMAEKGLDDAISEALPDGATQSGDGGPAGLLERFTLRGTIVGQLGTPFLLPDPRDPARLVAIAGLGLPGRFGEGELTVVARELCWALAQLDRSHIATVVIGAGTGNLQVKQAISAWMRGIAEALSEARVGGPRIRRITFVELDPERVKRVDSALKAEARKAARLEAAHEQDERKPRARLRIKYDAQTAEQLEELRKMASRNEREEFKRRWSSEGDEDGENVAPTRVTLGLEGGTYRFGAITQTAAVPERDVPLDPALVNQANDELAAETDPDRRRVRGRFLTELLFPDELREGLAGNAPLVMLLDSSTARIHWELATDPAVEPSRAGRADDTSDYLAISRGFTRQLRTPFALPPDPPPPPQRLLRVLIVADPAEDRHLPGAEEEGIEVAKIFERLGHTKKADVEVVTLLGPRMAKRTTVLQKLLLERFHVMHYAGHCQYIEDDPARTGWLFTGGEVLSASELRRIDRVPDFIFSNACESGVTPDRSSRRSAGLAPTFAESFFARGVKNFVCTAWPVDDAAARTFAEQLYRGLFGLVEGEEDTAPPQVMHRAMRDARQAIANTAGGSRTWGAYQHYGDPHYRLLA